MYFCSLASVAVNFPCSKRVFCCRSLMASLVSFSSAPATVIFCASCTASSANSLFFRPWKIAVRPTDVPAMPQPMGPAKANNAWPPATPAPPALSAPPPSQASAAFVATAPDRLEIAVPVEAVPKVVATHIIAVGAMLATAAPPATPAAAPKPIFLLSSEARIANSSVARNFSLSAEII